MTTADLPSLLTRVQAATGPDRELDEAIGKWLWAKGYNPWDCFNYNKDRDVHGKPFTSSIDAALALVEKLLPGWRYAMASVVLGKDEHDHVPWCGLAGPYSSCTFNDHEGRATTPPLAILAALLSALIAKDKDK